MSYCFQHPLQILRKLLTSAWRALSVSPVPYIPSLSLTKPKTFKSTMQYTQLLLQPLISQHILLYRQKFLHIPPPLSGVDYTCINKRCLPFHDYRYTGKQVQHNSNPDFAKKSFYCKNANNGVPREVYGRTKVAKREIWKYPRKA